MATLKLILDTRHKKQNGTYPLAFRLTHLSKSTTIPTSLALELPDWDTKKQRVRKSNPNFETLNLELTKQKIAYQKGLLLLDSINTLDVTTIKDKITGKTPAIVKLGFFKFTQQLIEQLNATNKIGNADVYQCANNSLMQFTKEPSLKFEQINYKLLIGYESHLIKKGLKANTIANYMRTIRAIFNKSIKVGNTGIEHYPFKSYSVKHERTVAKVLSPAEFQKIIQLDLSVDSPEYLSRLVFLLMFNLIGISFADLITLRQENIVDGRIIYRRKKTKRIYSIKINEYAQLILDELKLNNPASDFLLPIFDKSAITSKQEKQTIKQKLKICNKYLKRIGKLLELPFPVSTYCSRYTWATTAKRLGYSNEIIAEALGHQYGNSVTSTYLDSFSQDVIDNANLVVCNNMFK